MAEERTSLVLDITTASNKKAQRSVTYINPDASDNELLNFAQQLNGVTVNTLDKVSRVDKKTLEPQNYKIIGPDVLAIQHWDEPQNTSGMYYLVDSTNAVVDDADFSFVCDYDTTKAEVNSIASNTTIVLTSLVTSNEYYRFFGTISATLENNVTISKIIEFIVLAD